MRTIVVIVTVIWAFTSNVQGLASGSLRSRTKPRISLRVKIELLVLLHQIVFRDKHPISSREYWKENRSGQSQNAPLNKVGLVPLPAFRNVTWELKHNLQGHYLTNHVSHRKLLVDQGEKGMRWGFPSCISESQTNRAHSSHLQTHI